jgi:hypothetical protein
MEEAERSEATAILAGDHVGEQWRDRDNCCRREAIAPMEVFPRTGYC